MSFGNEEENMEIPPIGNQEEEKEFEGNSLLTNQEICDLQNLVTKLTEENPLSTKEEIKGLHNLVSKLREENQELQDSLARVSEENEALQRQVQGACSLDSSQTEEIQ